MKKYLLVASLLVMATSVMAQRRPRPIPRPLPPLPTRNVETITCSSFDRRYSQCQVSTRVQQSVVGVVLLRQLSNAACIQGVTFGRTANGVWVDRGCRGTFQVQLNGRRPLPRPGRQIVSRTCSAKMTGPRGRRTLGLFTGYASGIKGTGVKQRACQDARQQCQSAKRRQGRTQAVCQVQR